jgi:hypothetical protein
LKTVTTTTTNENWNHYRLRHLDKQPSQQGATKRNDQQATTAVMLPPTPTPHPHAPVVVLEASQEHQHQELHSHPQEPPVAPSAMTTEEQEQVEAAGLDDQLDHDYSLKRPLEDVQQVHEFSYEDEHQQEQQDEEGHMDKRAKNNNEEEELFMMEDVHVNHVHNPDDLLLLNHTTNTNNNTNNISISAPAAAVAAAAKKVNNEQWEAMFARLIQYKHQHGDCLVPKRYVQDPKLGTWVETQVSKILYCFVSLEGGYSIISYTLDSHHSILFIHFSESSIQTFASNPQ